MGAAGCTRPDPDNSNDLEGVGGARAGGGGFAGQDDGDALDLLDQRLELFLFIGAIGSVILGQLLFGLGV